MAKKKPTNPNLLAELTVTDDVTGRRYAVAVERSAYGVRVAVMPRRGASLRPAVCDVLVDLYDNKMRVLGWDGAAQDNDPSSEMTVVKDMAAELAGYAPGLAAAREEEKQCRQTGTKS